MLDPALIKNLPRILLRFCLHKIAITLDIEKAFLQIGLQPEDHDSTPFFWIKHVKDPKNLMALMAIWRYCVSPGFCLNLHFFAHFLAPV